MNAPLNNAVRLALENVTLDDKLLRGLQHKYTVSSAAGHSGWGVQRCKQGGVL